MPRPASTEAGRAKASGAMARPARPTSSEPIARYSAGRRSGRRPISADTSRPAAISATVTAPSRLPAATGVQPSAV